MKKVEEDPKYLQRYKLLDKVISELNTAIELTEDPDLVKKLKQARGLIKKSLFEF